MSGYVAIKMYNEIFVHAEGNNGTYATLCGLDGDDSNPFVDQTTVEVPKGAKINCEHCKQIIMDARLYNKRDFEGSTE